MGPTVASLVQTKSVQPQSHLLPRYSAAARRPGGRQNSRKSRDWPMISRAVATAGVSGKPLPHAAPRGEVDRE
jgi:hypothetical protein